MKRKKIIVSDDEYQVDVEEVMESGEEEVPSSSRSPHKKKRKSQVKSANKVKCSECLYVAPNQSRLERHFKHRHAGHACELCDEVCQTYSLLRKHLAAQHPIVHKCEQCEYSNKKKSEVRRHYIKMHVNGVPCTISGCTMRVAKNRLKAHLMKMHGDRTKPRDGFPSTSEQSNEHELVRLVTSEFPCHHCEFVAADSEDIMEHVKRVHLHGVSCPVSGCSTTVPLADLERHLDEKHSGQIGLKEENQDKEANECTTVSEHTVSSSCSSDDSDWRDEQRLSDDETERIVGDEAREKMHIEVIGGDNGSFGCTLCRKFYETAERLRKHIKRIHERVYSECKAVKKEKGHKCDWPGCEKSYRTKGLLEDHLNGHKGISPYECVKCVQRFSSRAQFAVHLSKYHQTSIRKYTQLLAILPTAKA